MKLTKTEDAVGHVLCHDMTQIIKDEYKDARFRKGHVVTEEDIPQLDPLGETTRQPAVAEMITYAEDRDRGRTLFSEESELFSEDAPPVRQLRRDGTDG